MLKFIRQLIRGEQPAEPSNVSLETIEQIKADYRLRIAELQHELLAVKLKESALSNRLRLCGIDPDAEKIDQHDSKYVSVENSIKALEDTWEVHVGQVARQLEGSDKAAFQQLATMLPVFHEALRMAAKRLILEGRDLGEKALTQARECQAYFNKLIELGIDPRDVWNSTKQ